MPKKTPTHRFEAPKPVRKKKSLATAHEVDTPVDLIVGTVSAHPDGFGFLGVEDGLGDVFLGEETMKNALHGDTVSVRLQPLDHRGKRRGEIVEVLQRAISHTVGTLHNREKVWFVVAKDARIAQDIVVAKAKLNGAKDGDIVDVAITRYPSADDEPQGEIVGVLGAPTDDGIEIEIALRQFDLPHVWNEAVQSAEKKLPKKVRKSDLTADRVDLRHIAFVTIDGETAKDFDDAVYAEKRRIGYRVMVAIADVSHYVTPNSAIDKEARERSTSVYFPRRVIPMLPEALSNEMCSLKPEVDRLALVCDIEINADGKTTGYKFFPAVIHSRARLTYTQVWAWLSNAQTPQTPAHEAVQPNLAMLYRAYKALRAQREKRGAIDFESNETGIEFSDSGKIERMFPIERNDAHKLIEECMLAANECAAIFLLGGKTPSLYRNHEGPTPQKLETLRQFLSRHLITLGGGLTPQPRDYAELAKLTANREDAALIHMLILRSMQQARYAPDNLGHFGLAYPAYTHFTSPIRRYPDLIVHRAIKAQLAKEPPKFGDLQNLGEHTSANERRADEASRAVMNYLKCVYMADHVGDEFEGTVSGIQNFGVFVTLDGMAIDGLIHVSTLPQDYYKYDPVGQRLIGERRGRTFQIAQKIRIVVARADIEAMKIDFALADGQ